MNENQKDMDCCMKTARTWVENGGDAEGLVYCFDLLKQCVELHIDGDSKDDRN